MRAPALRLAALRPTRTAPYQRCVDCYPRNMRSGWCLGFAVALMACAPAEPRYPEVDLDAADAAFYRQAREREANAAFDGIRYDEHGRAIVTAPQADVPGTGQEGVPQQPRDRFAVRSLGQDPPPAPRPPPSGRRDIELFDAPLDNALRLLADSGRFNLVIHDGLQGRVTVSLRNVEPYDALLVIARSHRLRVELDGNIVVVMPARQ
jgi:hypothetical protein